MYLKRPRWGCAGGRKKRKREEGGHAKAGLLTGQTIPEHAVSRGKTRRASMRDTACLEKRPRSLIEKTVLALPEAGRLSTSFQQHRPRLSTTHATVIGRHGRCHSPMPTPPPHNSHGQDPDTPAQPRHIRDHRKRLSALNDGVTFINFIEHDTAVKSQ